MHFWAVALICVLQQEYSCACRMLDWEFTGPGLSEDNGGNINVCGRIADHYVLCGDRVSLLLVNMAEGRMSGQLDWQWWWLCVCFDQTWKQRH